MGEDAPDDDEHHHEEQGRDPQVEDAEPGPPLVGEQQNGDGAPTRSAA
ncbi:hypothetical protein [Actinoalloteichus caeruleus]|nr:hypothetical protein [Actinoalloteichus caeruleus]